MISIFILPKWDIFHVRMLNGFHGNHTFEKYTHSWAVAVHTFNLLNPALSRQRVQGQPLCLLRNLNLCSCTLLS